MKTQLVEVHLFQKGNRVMTPCGVGVVLEDEIWNKDSESWREILVQHDEGLSANPSNRPQKMDFNALILGDF
jgi:hypothetical protein